jgi:hypothetical protein
MMFPLIILFGIFRLAHAVESAAGFEFREEGKQWFLSSKQANLLDILADISVKTGVSFHFSVLPLTPITSTCVGKSVKDIMECLMGGKVDMVFRNAGKGFANQRQTQEVWLLGSSLSQSGKDVCQATQDGVFFSEKALPSKFLSAEPSEEDKLLFHKQTALSGNPQARAQSIAYLTVHADNDDKELQQVLNEALRDENNEVRGQALASLVARDGEHAAIPELQLALQDTDSAMRLMALQHINESKVLIEKALQDENALVRQFAQQKLRGN